MPSTVPASRPGLDSCPGVLALHEAADGLLARIRIPGGIVSAAQLGVLADVAAEFGDGGLELTSRGNVQIRGIDGATGNALAQRLSAAGLLPSSTHDRVRNIVASPLSGIDGTADRLDDLVAKLDRDLCAAPVLADLPGRFLFALDDGRGDVASLTADVTAVVVGEHALVEAVDVPRADVVPLMLKIAEEFLAVRAEQGATAWRMAELDGGIAAVLDRLDLRALPTAASLAPPAPAGLIEQPDGRTALVVIAPFGRLDAAQLSYLVANAGLRGVRFTPWRSVVIPDLLDGPPAAAQAEGLGFGIDASSPWHRVTTCVGRPGCAQALADVRADARADLAAWPGRQVRWSGCERRCGRPHDTEVDVIATVGGYQIVERVR